jgi:hypothetical protein
VEEVRPAGGEREVTSGAEGDGEEARPAEGQRAVEPHFCSFSTSP